MAMAIIRVPSVAHNEEQQETVSNTSKYLSPFQKEKFSYLFEAFFDLDKNNLLEEKDINALVEKLRTFAGWSKDSDRYHHIVDVHRVFYECLQDQVRNEKAADESTEIASWEEAKKPSKVDTSSITSKQWLNMWGKMCYGSAGISGFPIWVQMIPNIFFDVIDKDNDGVLSYDEIKAFYQNMVNVPKSQLDKVVKEGYRAMTANGDYVLNRENYLFCFANFLLGRTIYGPGKYIFGVFDNSDIDVQFTVIYNDEDEE